MRYSLTIDGNEPDDTRIGDATTGVRMTDEEQLRVAEHAVERIRARIERDAARAVPPPPVDPTVPPWRIVANVPQAAYAGLKASIVACGGRVLAGYADDGTDSAPEGDRA